MAELLAPAPRIRPSMQLSPRRSAFAWKPDWALLCVVAGSLVMGAVAYEQFLSHPRQLWDRGPHDRNYHYLAGLNFCLSFRAADLPYFLQTVDKQRTWGLLHGLLVGGIMAGPGADYRLAVLPSLFAWIGTAILGFLLARRLVLRGGTLAGLAAAFFILASPAHHAFATDIMLESMGACLTLWVMHCYLIALQEPSPRAYCLLGLALTLLFFLKANYWMLAVFGLVGAEIWRRPGFYKDWLINLLGAVAWKDWLFRQPRRPMNYVLGLLLGAIGWVMMTGGGEYIVFGHTISVANPHNLVHLAFAIVFFRGVVWWHRHGNDLCAAAGPEFPLLFRWHVMPIAIYFLFPKRLGYFLWYLSPANAATNETSSLSEGLRQYWQWMAGDYHIGVWSLFLVLGLLIVGLCALRKLKPGSAAVICLFLVAFSLATMHPNRKSRFLHTWMAAGWVVAGAGLAQVVYGRYLSTRASNLAGSIALGALGLAFVPSMLEPHKVIDGGPNLQQDSNLVLSETYLPELKDVRKTLILSNSAVEFLCQWTYLEKYGKLRGVDTDIKNFGHDLEQNRKLFHDWLAHHAYDAVVFVDIPGDSYFFEPAGHPAYEQIQVFFKEQIRFEQTKHWDFPQYGCGITLWTPRPVVLSRRQDG